MNYYGPRELQDQDGEPTGTYHYTRRHDSRVWSMGYCSGDPPTTREEFDEPKGPNAVSERHPDGWDSELAERDRELLDEYRRRADQYGEKYHDDGHKSKEAARQCFTEFCLDMYLVLYDDDPEYRDFRLAVEDLSEPVEDDETPADVEASECPVDGCDTLVAYPTASIRSTTASRDHLHLCSDHCDRESVASFWKAPMESFGSL